MQHAVYVKTLVDEYDEALIRPFGCRKYKGNNFQKWLQKKKKNVHLYRLMRKLSTSLLSHGVGFVMDMIEGLILFIIIIHASCFFWVEMYKFETFNLKSGKLKIPTSYVRMNIWKQHNYQYKRHYDYRTKSIS